MADEISPDVVALLAVGFATALQRTMSARKNYVERIQEQAVRNGNLIGALDLSGPGELHATLEFPVCFLDRPIFTAGLELGDNQWPAANNFPIWSATVINWSTRRIGNDVLVYDGVDLGIVLFAHEGAKASLHYSFLGQSLTNPVGGDLSVSEAQ